MKAIVIKDIPSECTGTDVLIEAGFVLQDENFERVRAWMYGEEWVCDLDSKTAEEHLEIISE